MEAVHCQSSSWDVSVCNGIEAEPATLMVDCTALVAYLVLAYIVRKPDLVALIALANRCGASSLRTSCSSLNGLVSYQLLKVHKE